VPKRLLLEIANRKQQGETDCLAACAAMMLNACGLVLPYDRLLSVLNVMPWGTPHRNIREIANIASRIHVIYQQGELNDLRCALDAGLPPTVFVWTGELSYWSVETWHAIVLVGYDMRNFYVNDPAFDIAPQLVSEGDFALAWLAYDSYYAIVKCE
jgi:ABC-type bacteriocin/lantibiotic exporter with double-glycine peptidase domain